MNGRATTTVSIYRGTTTDTFGDEVDDNSTPAATGVTASLLEQSRRVFVPAENRMTVVRIVTGRLTSGVDVQEADRLKDERTEKVYLVEAVSAPQSPIGKADIKLDLRRIDD